MATSAYLDTLKRGSESQQYEQKTINRLQAEVSRIQKKTYTNWINSHLKSCNMEVTDLYTDLRDGKRLMQLLEVISNAKLGKPNQGVIRLQKIENVGRALAFIKTKVHLENIGAEDIVDGNPTLILGLIWTIILRFQIEEAVYEIEPEQIGPQRSAKEALLLWCQNKTRGYEHVDVKDFTTSWRDGMAFGALLHSHDSDSIDMNKLRPDRPIENLTIAFNVAEKWFDIPPMLDPPDVNVPKPDERSILTYVSSMYQILNKRRNRNKNANRVGKTLNQAIKLSREITRYEVGIRDLLQWIRNKTAFFQRSTKDLPTTLQGAKAAISSFTQYRLVEKSQKYEERTKLEECLFTISLLTRELRAKAYTPTDPQLQLATISSAWETLLIAEREYWKAILEVHQRLKKFEQQLLRFEHQAKRRNEWLTDMEDLSERLQKVSGSQVGAARKAEALRMEIESKEKRFKELDKLATSIVKNRDYQRNSGVEQENANIQSRWAALSGAKMRALLARLAFPQTRADLLEQLAHSTSKLRELEKLLTQPTQGEMETKKNEDKSIPFEVIQAALDRHRIAEAEFQPLERKFLQIQNSAEKMWSNAPPMPNSESEKASDFKKCKAAIQLWNSVAERSLGRKAKLEGINSSYSLAAGLANELKWVTGKTSSLASVKAQTKDLKNARDLQLAQRLCKKYQATQSEVTAHGALWDDLKRSAEQFLNARPSGGSKGEDLLSDVRTSIRSQVATITSAWQNLREEMKSYEDAVNECLESAQFYADADEASRWIQEKIRLVEARGILVHPIGSEKELENALKMCGTDSSSTMAEKRRLTNLETEMEAFKSNDLQRLNYISTLLRKPMDSGLLRPELLVNKDADGSDIDSEVEGSVTGSKTTNTSAKNVEGRAQVIARYTAKDAAQRDISVEQGEIVTVIACTNSDWWHVRRNVRGQRNEGFVPANRLRLLEAPSSKAPSSRSDAFKAVKMEVSRGLSIRKAPSARSVNQLHFDKDNILKRERAVSDEFNKLHTCVQARDNCLEDTLAWHDFTMKGANFETWLRRKTEQLQRDSRNMKSHGPDSTHIEVTIEEISKGVPLLAEIRELADILTGVIKLSERPFYKRGSGELFYKKLAARRMDELQRQWEDLNKRKTSLEASITGSLGQFEKLAETMEILLSDRILQLESLPSSASNAEANDDLLRKVKTIKVEKPSLEEKMSRLRTIGNSVIQSQPSEASAVKSRLGGIDNLWDRLQKLLKSRENAYSAAAADLALKEKMNDLEGKLNDAEEQIGTLEPTGEIVANKTFFQSLLPPDVLKQKLRKAGELDEDLNLYDAATAELCSQARKLPEISTAKEQMRPAADALALKNEELKRKLEGKKDNLDSAIKAQNFASALNSIEGNIKELDMRLQMTEPLTSRTDVDREKRRVEKLKIELLKNITAIGVNEERIQAANLPRELSTPLLDKCKHLRNTAGGVIRRAEAREAEMEKIMQHVAYHDDASDLEEWLEEKKIAVQNIPTKVTDDSPLENLRQIRANIKKLGDIDSELVANQKALDNLKDQSTRLPSCADAANFPNPQKRFQDLNGNLMDLRRSIGSKVNDLKKGESAAQFNNDVDQIIKASVLAPQLAAAPGESADLAAQASRIPRNYAEAVNALNEAQRRRQKAMDDLAKLNEVEEKAKKAGAWTPELAAQVKKERDRLNRQLGNLDDEVRRNEDLVDWYKTVNEINMLKDWADDQTAQVQNDLRSQITFRTPQEQEAQRKRHKRLRDEIKLRDPRVQQLLNAKQRPVPRCLAGDPEAEQVRPNLSRSWTELQSAAAARSRQLDDANTKANLLGEIIELTKVINTRAADVDRLVNIKSNQTIDPSIKKLLEAEQYQKEVAPKVANLDSRVSEEISSSKIHPSFAKQLKNSSDEMKGALGDFNDKVNSAKRSIFFQKRMRSFDEKAEDQQQDITNALAFVSAVDIGDDPQQIENLKNRWQVFLADLPKLVKRVDDCLVEGQVLSEDLEILIAPKSAPVVSKAADSSQSTFGLTIGQMSMQPQSTYPLCNEQSVRAGAEQVRSQVERLSRDKGLLQQQVRLIQGRFDRTGDISHFSQAWEDLMELIRNRSANLTALSAVAPKSISALSVQVKKHEALESELVSIQQQVDDVTREGQEMVSFLRGSKQTSAQQTSKMETLIMDRLHRLQAAWKELNLKVVDRRKRLNECSRYLQFCEQVRDFLFWCHEAESEVVSIEPTAKAAAEAFAAMDQKMPLVGGRGKSKAPESIDVSQAELLQANYIRMSGELQQHWKPLSMKLVAEAESMIEENHYAAGDLKNKVDQMVVSQRSIDDGLKKYNQWILQLHDLLLLKREVSKFTSQTVVQHARVEAIMQECSSNNQASAKYAACDKLVSSLDVKSMIRRTEDIMKAVDASDDKVASFVKSANLMIQKKHYASAEIHDAVDKVQAARNIVKQICVDQLESLKRRLGQVLWEEDAEDVEGWLTEMESELGNLMKSPHKSNERQESSTEGENAVRTQLQMLQRQDKFQTSILGNKEHIEGVLSRGAKLVEAEEKLAGREGSSIGRRINERRRDIERRWGNLTASLASTSAVLEASRDLLRYQNEADALERWLREKDILLAKGDFGSDYEHCMALREKIHEPAAGKIVNDATVRDFQSLSTRLSQALRKPSLGTHSSVVALNKQTAAYVDSRTEDICNRWRRVQENLGKYSSQLEQAATIHEVISKIDSLLLQIGDRKVKASVRDDLTKTLTVSQLEAILRDLQTNERDVSVIEGQLKKVEEESARVVNSFTASVSKSQTSGLVQQITSKMGRLQTEIGETKMLFQQRRDLLESKLAAQRILEGCGQIVDWSNGVVKELKPHIVGTAVIGLAGKLAALKAARSGIKEITNEDKRRAFIGRLRRRLTDCQSELPLRQQQFTRLQTQSQQLKTETVEKKAIPNQLAQASEALRTAADILARLEIQVAIEEKRQAFAATGKQEDRWIESVQSQAQQAVKSAFRGLATDSDSSGDEENVQPMIVASTNGPQQYAAPPSEISPETCLAMLDSLASSLEDRNTLKNQFDELQKSQANSKEAQEIYTSDKIKEDRQLLEKTQEKAMTTSQNIAKMRAQVEARTECDSWFVSATESLEWMRSNQAQVASTYDWRITLKRFGENVPGSESDPSCGPKGSGGMARKVAAHRRFLVNIDVGLEMVDRLCERGEELARSNPKKANKVKKMIEELKAESMRLRSTCEERTRRMNEANELVEWGQLVDKARETAQQTEAQLMIDDYHKGENGLKRLLESQEVLARDIQEAQRARVEGLLKTANEAERKGHFAGAKMVAEAQDLANTVKVALVQLVQARLSAIKVMITWRRLEKDLRVENTWLTEQLNGNLLGNESQSMQNLDYDTATKYLKSLSELASRLASQTPKINEIVDGVKKLVEAGSQDTKSILSELGTLQEASRSANQLMNLKSELESRVCVRARYLIAEHLYLQYVHDIRESQEWIKANFHPVSKLAPMTDSSGTKAALQNVSRLRGDVAAFQRNTIGPLSARLQQRSMVDDEKSVDFIATEERTQALVGDDLRKLLGMYHGGTEQHQQKNIQSNLNQEMEELMTRFDILNVYLELVELRLKLRIGVNAYNTQGDEFNKFLSTLETDVNSKDYGVDLEECRALLAKFTERLESTSNSGSSQLKNLTKHAQQLADTAESLTAKIDKEEQRVSKTRYSESQEALPVKEELLGLRGGVQLDMRTVRERQAVLDQAWVETRTGMKRRKENLQSAMHVHSYKSDVADLLEWISEKSPGGRENRMDAALISRMNSLMDKRPEANLKKSTGLDKALTDQEKLRREVNAMQKQVDKQEAERNRLKKDFPDQASEVEAQWTRLQTAWGALQTSVGAEKQRLSEAQQVTQWQSRCNLLSGWADEQRLAMLATREMPTDLTEAQNLLDLHRQIRSQITKRLPEKEDIIRSGQDLSNSIPSSKIVIQKSLERLEAAWSQMHSVWSSRNSLYDKNLDLRKLYAEMAELDAWLDDQEQRLEDTTKIVSENASVASVEQAMAKHADIEKAIEDARQRFDAIRRKTLVETLKFEMLKLMTKRGEGSAVGDQPFSNERIAEIKRRETSKLIRNRPKQVAASVDPVEQKNEKKLQDIFGNLAPIEPSIEQNVQHAAPPVPEVPLAPHLNDSFGMTNAHFERQSSESSDIDSLPPSKPIEARPPSPSRQVRSPSTPFSPFKDSRKFGRMVTRNSSDASISSVSAGVTGAESPVETSDRRGFKVLRSSSKSRQSEDRDSPSSFNSPVTETARGERMTFTPTFFQYSDGNASKPPPLPSDRHGRIQSGYDSYSSAYGREPEAHTSSRVSGTTTSRASDLWSQGDLASSPVNQMGHKIVSDYSESSSISKRSSSAYRHHEDASKADMMGFLARKILTDPKSHVPLVKKWIPSGQSGGYHWATLDGTRLSFYENDGAPTIGSAPLMVYNVQGAEVNVCAPKTSKTHPNVLQLRLEDGLVMLLAANTSENLERWQSILQSASYSGLSHSRSGTWKNRSSISSHDGGSHGKWSWSRSSSLKRKDTDDGAKHGTLSRLTRRMHKNSSSEKS